jgi:hypothetical protein
MDMRTDPAIRDRAMGLVRRATVGGVGGALGLTGIFSIAAAATFSGKPVAAQHPPAPPQVPFAAVPVQAPPRVVVHVIHHPAQGWSNAAGPRAPGSAPAPGAAPGFPPAPPACHSTPSRPC